MRYRVMARYSYQLRHHQEGPEYETREEAEQQASYWDGVGGCIAHVEPVPAPRQHHRSSKPTEGPHP